DVHNRMRRREEALQYYEKALLLYEEGLAPHKDTEPSFAMLRLLTEMGLTAAQLRKWDAAHRYLKRAESLATECRTLYRWGDLCRSMSRVEKERGNRREAIHWAERAVAYCDSVLDHIVLVRALVDLGELRSSEGRKAAMPFFERAMDVAQAKGDADGKSRVRAALAKLAEQEGDVKQAVELYQSAVNSSEDGWRTSDIRRSLANLFIARKDWEAAAKQLESNVAFYEKQRCNKSLIETYSTLAEVYEAAGKSEDAARCLRLSMDLYRSQSE
ncbi:MAG: tetratricopeptide repeat protein, partial [Limnochordales bacterium]